MPTLDDAIEAVRDWKDVAEGERDSYLPHNPEEAASYGRQAAALAHALALLKGLRWRKIETAPEGELIELLFVYSDAYDQFGRYIGRLYVHGKEPEWLDQADDTICTPSNPALKFWRPLGPTPPQPETRP